MKTLSLLPISFGVAIALGSSSSHAVDFNYPAGDFVTKRRLAMNAKRSLRSGALSAVLLALAPNALATDFIFNTGSYNPNVTAPDPLLLGDVLQINAGGNKFFSAVTFNNQGTVNWNTDTLFFQSGAVVNNSGLWDSRSNDTLANNGGATPTFNNTGTFRKSVGTGVTTIGSISFVNSGIIDAQTGTISFAGNNATFNPGSQFTGTGTVAVNSNATFNGAITASPTLSLRAGTFTGNSLVLSGNPEFTGGTIAGAWELAAGQTLTARAGGNKFLSGATLTNKGTFSWATTDTLFLQSGTVLDNQGTFDFQQDATIANNGGTTPIFKNSGSLAVATGRTGNIGGIQFVNNGGTLDAVGILNFGGSNARFNDGTHFNGTGVNNINSNASFVGNFTSQNLHLNAGIFTGGDGSPGSKAVVNGTADFTGGTITGAWEVAAGQTLSGKGGSNKFLSGAAFTNKGTLSWQTTDTLFLQSGSHISNQGTIDFQADSAVVFNGGAVGTFVNTGLIVKSAGSATTTIGNNLGFDNQGVIDVRSGTIQLPTNFDNAGTLMGTGAFTSNALTNNGHVAPGGATPGTLTLNGNYTQSASGTLDIALESLSSAGLFTVSGTTTLAGKLALHCSGNCNFGVGDELTILNGVSTLSGTFSEVLFFGFGSGAAVDVIYDHVANDVKLHVLQALSPAPVPVPAAVWLMLGALGSLTRMTRRSRTVASIF